MTVSPPAGAVPDDLMQPLRAFQESRIILSALELDVFSAVGPGATADTVALARQTDARGTERLLNALVAIGLMRKVDRIFHNAPLAARFLSADSPDDARDALKHQVSLWRRWSTLTEVVRTGHPAPTADAGGSEESWTVPFIAAMHKNAQQRAPLVVQALGAERITRMLDVGGGSGAYSIAFALTNQALRAEILDLPSVLPIAEGHVTAAGLAGRVTTRAGDLRRDDLGSGYDLVLLSSICHMLGPDANRDLLKRVFRALLPGGRVAISDFILAPDGTEPRHAVLFAINMLVGTEAGGTYTEGEYTGWLTGTGFIDVRRLRLGGPADLIVGQHP